MKIRYGINKRKQGANKGRRAHENHELVLSDIPDEKWESDETHEAIKAEIRRLHPGWHITGYAIIRPSLAILPNNFIIVCRPSGNLTIAGPIAHKVYFRAKAEVEALREDTSFYVGDVYTFAPAFSVDGQTAKLGSPVSSGRGLTEAQGDLIVMFSPDNRPLMPYENH